MEERLQKIIARAGVASRRHAEELIASGLVTVNGAVVTKLGSKADASRDHIKVSGKLLLGAPERVYIVFHKPPEIVSTMSDPEGRRSLRDFLGGVPERVFPVGRLEYHSSGLVLLTSDGDLANRVLQSHHLPQTYHLKLKSLLTFAEIEDLARSTGARISRLREKDTPWYEVTLPEPSRDDLRKRLFRTGHPVERIKRVRIANLELGSLAAGQYRALSQAEVAALSRALQDTSAARPAPEPIKRSAPVRRAPERPRQGAPVRRESGGPGRRTPFRPASDTARRGSYSRPAPYPAREGTPSDPVQSGPERRAPFRPAPDREQRSATSRPAPGGPGRRAPFRPSQDPTRRGSHSRPAPSGPKRRAPFRPAPRQGAPSGGPERPTPFRPGSDPMRRSVPSRHAPGHGRGHAPPRDGQKKVFSRPPDRRPDGPPRRSSGKPGSHSPGNSWQPKKSSSGRPVWPSKKRGSRSARPPKKSGSGPAWPPGGKFPS